MDIAYFTMADAPEVVLRFGVSDEGEEPQWVEDIWRPGDNGWMEWAEVSRFVMFEHSDLVAISADEASTITGGHATDPPVGVLPATPPVANGPYLD